jgi:hypothetical protein
MRVFLTFLYAHCNNRHVYVSIATHRAFVCSAKYCDFRVVMVRGLVVDWILRGDVIWLAQFSDYVRGSVIYGLSIASGAYPL